MWTNLFFRLERKFDNYELNPLHPHNLYFSKYLNIHHYYPHKSEIKVSDRVKSILIGIFIVRLLRVYWYYRIPLV